MKIPVPNPLPRPASIATNRNVRKPFVSGRSAVAILRSNKTCDQVRLPSNVIKDHARWKEHRHVDGRRKTNDQANLTGTQANSRSPHGKQKHSRVAKIGKKEHYRSALDQGVAKADNDLNDA